MASTLNIYGNMQQLYFNDVNIIIDDVYYLKYNCEYNYEETCFEERIYFYYYYGENNDEIRFINAVLNKNGKIRILNSDLSYLQNEMTKITNNNYTIYCSNPSITLNMEYDVNCDNNNKIDVKFVFYKN